MKIKWLILLLLIVALLVTSVPAMAVPPNVNQGQNDIDKITFVHYPKHEASRPDVGGGGSILTGTLCPDYKYSGIHWGSSMVEYYVNTNNDQYLDGVQDSFATWNSASTKINFHYAGFNSAQGNTRDFKNVISWGPVEYNNAIAVTYFWYSRSTKLIAEVDTVMNSALPWAYEDIGTATNLSGPAVASAVRYADPTGYSPDPNSYDVRNIMTHEAGHWILLNDLYNGKDSKLTMYGYGDYGEISKDTLGYGDELGIEKAYGQ